MATPKAERPPRVLRPFVESRSVLVLREKHGDLYFVVDGDEELFSIALMVLRGRLKAEYWYCDPGEPPPGPGFTKEEAENLPMVLREPAFSQLRRHADAVRAHRHDKEEWDEINLVCASGDGRAAWRTLSDRSDHEYESARLEPARTEY